MPSTPRQQCPIGFAAREVVENLIRADLRATGGVELVHVLDVEVADAPPQDFPGMHERLELLDDLGERRAAAPVQQVQIEAVGAEAAQAAIARGDRAAARGVLRIDLADQVHVVAASGDRFADHLLRAALPVHLRRVDQPESEVETESQGRDLGVTLVRVLSHAPGSEAESRQRGRHRPIVIVRASFRQWGPIRR